jgi:protein arginine N-methyltransferase 7
MSRVLAPRQRSAVQRNDGPVCRRWDTAYEGVRMQDTPHRVLTRPKKVFEFFFDGALKSTAQEGVIKLELIADGCLNAVCFWFDLHLDEEATLTSAPPGVGKGGQLHADSNTAPASVRPSDAFCACIREMLSRSAPQEPPGASEAGVKPNGTPSSPSHYWGQALQYLERSTLVRACAASLCARARAYT